MKIHIRKITDKSIMPMLAALVLLAVLLIIPTGFEEVLHIRALSAFVRRLFPPTKATLWIPDLSAPASSGARFCCSAAALREEPFRR